MNSISPGRMALMTRSVWTRSPSPRVRPADQHDGLGALHERAAADVELEVLEVGRHARLVGQDLELAGHDLAIGITAHVVQAQLDGREGLECQVEVPLGDVLLHAGEYFVEVFDAGSALAVVGVELLADGHDGIVDLQLQPALGGDEADRRSLLRGARRRARYRQERLDLRAQGHLLDHVLRGGSTAPRDPPASACAARAPRPPESALRPRGCSDRPERARADRPTGRGGRAVRGTGTRRPRATCACARSRPRAARACARSPRS